MKALKNYPPKLFHSSSIDDALKIAGQFKFASIYATDEDCDIVLAPLYHLYEQNNKKEFYGHFVRNNPLFQLLKNKGELPCRVMFNAAEAYISPSCYKAKQITQNVVPTWNYVAAQFKGTMKLVPDEELYSLLEKEVELFEKAAQSEWKLTDATPQYVSQLSKSIFGVRIELISWKAHMKLSQNKGDEIQNVRKWCQHRESQKKSILSWMDEFK